MTKKEQALQIYHDLTDRNHGDRALIVRRFQDALDMTPAGAATYYAMCKKHYEQGASTPATKSSKTVKASAGKSVRESTDNRTLHHVAYMDEDGKVYETSSYFNIDDANAEHKASKGNSKVVSGKLPEIEVHQESATSKVRGSYA